MSVDGEGAFGGAVEGRGELEEGAGGAEQGEQSHEEGGVHDMFAEVFLSAQQAKNQKDYAEVGGDQGGFGDRTGKGKGEDSD